MESVINTAASTSGRKNTVENILFGCFMMLVVAFLGHAHYFFQEYADSMLHGVG